MLSLPNPYILLGAGVFYVASVVGGALWWGHQKTLAYELKIANQERRAQVILAEATAESARRDNEYAELARSKDEKYNHDVAEITTNYDAAVASLTKRVRVLTRRGESGSGTAATETASSGVLAGATQDNGLSESVGRRLATVGQNANELAVYANACYEWAQSVGR